MNKIQNVAIMASAGTGKTFSLAMRYIHLLELGVEPDEIVAMTFTNKAAGEIFDKIIEELLSMLTDPKKISGLVQTGVLPPETNRESLFMIFRKVLCTPKKLRICTLDSFFFHIIEAFPFECGVAGEITMLSENDDELRVDSLLRLIRDSEAKQRSAILELIKRVSLNTEPFSIFEPAKKIIEEFYAEYLKYPEEMLWDNAAYLDPEVSEEDFLKDEELFSAGAVLQRASETTSGRSAEYFLKLAALADFAVQYTRIPVDLKSDSIVSKLYELDPEWLNAASLETSYYRSVVSLEGDALDALKRIVRHLLAVEYRNITNRTAAIYQLLRKFDDRYALSARRNGNLTFKDIVFLLKNDSPGNPFADRLILEERLDSKYNHYLLDEFQDTSDEQWRIMENLVDEIFQPGQERFRSFFYVGDIKQSIYQWRDGNPELFGTIYRRYSDSGFDESQLHISTLAKSYRSSIPVIDTVNRVFEHPEKISNEIVEEAIRKMDFETHSSADSAASQPGYAVLLECDENGETAVSAESVFELLLSLDPFSDAHDCTVGVLTLGNDFASEMGERFHELIRACGLEHEFAVSVEGVMLLNSSMAFAIYKNLLILAEHPADPMARGFLSMVTLSGSERKLTSLSILYGEKEPAPSDDVWFEKAGRHIRNSITANGFTQFLRRFCRIFSSALADFDSKRMSLAIDSAMHFDSTGNKNISDFLHYLDCMESKSNSVRKTVQFMTIHKSKGLDFDIVILPDLYNRTSLDSRNPSPGKLLTAKDSSFEPQWVTYPPKTALRDYYSAIRDANAASADSKTYERCCQLYVAMTRARNALYMMIPKVESKKETETLRFPDILKRTLTQESVAIPESVHRKTSELSNRLGRAIIPLYSEGDPDWILRKNGKKEVQTDELGRLIRSALSRNAEVLPPEPVQTLKPSGHDGESFRETESGIGGRELGTHLHELIARISFLDECDTEELLSDYLQTTTLGKDEKDALAEIFRNAVSSPDAGKMFTRPNLGFAELWREKQFCIRRGGAMLPCVFDRVLIIRDETGKVLQIQIVDFKSDRSSDPEYFREHYSGQLNLYADALKAVFGCEPEKNIYMLRSGKNLLLS